MLHQLILILLAPVFLAQGTYVRKSIPCLKEADGPRKGKTEPRAPFAKKPLRILLLGDSAAAGVGAEHQSHALSGQLVNALKQHFYLEWQLIAKTGFTTQQVLQSVTAHPKQAFDIVVLSVGVNDVTKPTSANQWIKRQQTLTDTLRHHFDCQQIIFTKIPPMEKFPALPYPLRWYLGSKAKAFNRKLSTWASTQHDCELLDLNQALSIEHMATDGFHPGPEIYRFWGASVAQVIKSRWMP
ncbi:SGNH/GDSL hydrolase family protein [Photobacterium sanctipauli]|uniref:SGNH/GDSL hydrolase family protein n=1 Tax=Photobacterium sanctipauli TaxID=1342794 RepID=A0A2T3NZ14_9GAMM|nr:SGNH/GDSL hydrolase family protein [Photobacterium sanctipauli]PSW21514.1 SGNH/GDSL hydrolase family protein [Photobacterium sanctipauli]